MSTSPLALLHPHRPPHRRVRAHDPQGALYFMIALSLALHLAIIVLIHRQPLGHLDPVLVQPANPAFRVLRADDLIVEELPDPASSPTQFDPQNPQNLSQQWLQSPIPDAPPQPGPLAAPSDTNAPPDPARALGPSPLPDTSPQTLAGLPVVQLPPTLLRTTPTLPTPPDGAGDPAAEASRLLAGAGSAWTPPTGTAPGIGSGTTSGTGVVPRSTAPTAAPRAVSPPIDYAGPALAPVAQLALPENLDDDFDYAVSVHPPDPARDPAGYFRVDITPRRSLRKLKTMPKDVVYLLDTSSSVPPNWVAAAVQGVSDSLASLNDGDRFNIVMFKDQPALFSADAIQPATQANIAAAQQFLRIARSSGFTDVNRALARLLLRDVAAQRAYYLVLITDGIPTRGILDTRELINLITRDNDLAASIYCVGIGRKQNRELLNYLAYRNKGFCVFIDEHDRATAAVRDLMSRLRYPIIKDVRLGVAGLAIGNVFPHHLPNIHQGETFSVFGRCDRMGLFTMNMSGRGLAAPVDFNFTRDLTQMPRGDAQIPRDWAFWKLHHLYSQIQRDGDNPAAQAEIQRLRRDFGVKTLP